MLSSNSKCAVCDSGLLNSLGIKTPLNKIPLSGPLFFNSIKQVNTRYKMNEIVNKFLSAGDKFISEMDLSHPGLTYSACGLYTKNKERIQKFKETGDSRYIYENELDKTCFQHDMAYGDSNI